ncbi:MAG: glycosyltransferase [Proteobacteria bacterium]|nr:glycosyltransferase [Pseudomonadota bacterium]
MSNVIAYVDELFTPSESFVHRAYRAFDTLTPVFVGNSLRSAAPAGARVINIKSLHGLGGEAAFKQLGLVSEPLRKRLEAEKPIAIHAHFGKGGVYAMPLARALNVPLVVTYYGGDATKKMNTRWLPLRAYNRRRSQMWREAALILPCSDFIRRELEMRGCPNDKMVVHYNSADPDRFSPGEKQNILLFAGRWTEKKGIGTLIAALARVGPKLKGWRVRLLGDGELKPPLVAQLNAAGVQAELPGWIPADEMPKHFAEATIVCVPSQRAQSGDAEGLPLVCVEAMLSNCALAATKHAGIPECVEDGRTGYLVDERDDVALADRIGRMLDDPARTRAMGEAGRALALDRFNLQKLSRRLQDHLLRVAREKETGGTAG